MMIGKTGYRAVAMLALFHGGAVAQAPSGFCARLAPELGLSFKAGAKGGYWQTNTLNPAQRLLIGGSSSVSLGMTFANDADRSAAKAADLGCRAVPKGASCKVAGPSRVQVGVKDKITDVAAEPGEHAEVRVIGTRIQCEDRL